MLDTGPDGQYPSIVEQLVDTSGDSLFPNENVDPEALPKAGAFKLDVLTSKILLLIAMSGMLSLGFLTSRQR
ncbi:MAG: hypothetical protein H6765_07110 [Candidatus Peribacteria bacterium]|nr:MAG: hypothetical protein H6765_07110 [Candidatus Peribacteria bacterium]